MKRNLSSESSVLTKKSKKNEINATEKLSTYFLNKSCTSFIKVIKLTDSNGGISMTEFEELWTLKPEKKHKIKIAGKEIECPRYTINYLKTYKFSGLEHEAIMTMPPIIQRLFDFAKTINPNLNQSLVNWYEGNGYIGKHSDDQRQLILNSDIFSFSFGPAAKRTFVLQNKTKQDEDNFHVVNLEHNILIIMSGHCQNTHYHSVPKNKYDDKQRRINVTFRCFKN